MSFYRVYSVLCGLWIIYGFVDVVVVGMNWMMVGGVYLVTYWNLKCIGQKLELEVDRMEFNGF